MCATSYKSWTNQITALQEKPLNGDMFSTIVVLAGGTRIGGTLLVGNPGPYEYLYCYYAYQTRDSN